SEVPTSSGLSGAEIAQKMLNDNRIYDVKITSVEGELTDHYNPENKTINLSREVYSGRSVSAAAVAAHETGHALQHATAYSMLQFRSAMVPIVSISSKLMNVIFILGFVGVFAMGFGQTLFLLIIIAQAVITLFSLVTLPVEYDASNRALAWLNDSGIARGSEYDKAADALKWAARTYLVATLAAVSQLLYFVLSFMGGSDD
ncbi:MAG: zinc metallopeptidase, partial [Salibacteraceae bacterium]|nr:zinc metallopeptidase [Salibacteraceae bacterium]